MKPTIDKAYDEQDRLVQGDCPLVVQTKKCNSRWVVRCRIAAASLDSAVASALQWEASGHQIRIRQDGRTILSR